MPPWIDCPHLRVPWKDSRFVVDVTDLQRAAAKRLLAAVGEEIPKAARHLAVLVHLRTRGRFLREVRAAARLAGADWRDLTLANLAYDFVVSRYGCSTVALATPGGPLLARNMDWWPEDLLARASCHLHFESAGVREFTSAAWPGGVGVVTGLSRRGFALALNAVLARERFLMTGYPVLLFLRHVLEDARDFDQAVLWCTRQRLMSPALITLVGRENHQRVVIERTPTRHALRRPNGDEPLIATNDYRSLDSSREGDRDVYLTACSRYEALEEFLDARSFPRNVSDDEILFRLADPRVMQSITAQHVVIRPRQESMRLCVPRSLVE